MVIFEKALNSFNFGPSLCKWFETLYSSASSCVINNGHLSHFCNLERGYQQGDPLSPYLFIIGVELFFVLEAFIFNPEALLNDSKHESVSFKDISLPSRIKNVSSAY
jgi:hypothetical protein